MPLVVAPTLAIGLLVALSKAEGRALRPLGVDLTRTVIDAVWITAGVLAGVWPWVATPAQSGASSNFSVLLALAGPVTTTMATAAVLFLLPLTTTRHARVSVLMLGTAVGLASVAAHLDVVARHATDSAAGPWSSYLWILSLGVLGVAAGRPSITGNIAMNERPAIAHHVVTAVPVFLAGIPFVVGGGWREVSPLLWWFLLALLAARVTIMIDHSSDLTQRLGHQATRDELTGLLNRRALLDVLEQDRLDRVDGPPPAVLFADLDGFKGINDLHGHGAGDHVLLAVARRLQASVRDNDVVARIGGDEFVVLARGGDPAAIAARIRRAVIAPIDWERFSLKVGCSIGISRDDSIEPAELLRKADAALYRAKNLGGNVVVDGDQADPELEADQEQTRPSLKPRKTSATAKAAANGTSP